jgi:hypothetical protein
MDEIDRMCSKLDDAAKKIDEIGAKVRESRQYNQNTAMLVIILWGVGLPVVLFVSMLYAAMRY